MCELAPLCYFGTDTNYRQVGIRLLVVQSESFSGTCTIARVGLLKKLKELMMTLWWPWRHSVATLPTLECETTQPPGHNNQEKPAAQAPLQMLGSKAACQRLEAV